MRNIWDEVGKPCSNSRAGASGGPASAEFARHDDPIHAVSAEHKRLMLGYVRELAEAAGVGASEVLAVQLCLLIEGTIALVQVTGRIEACKEARAAAAILVRDALARSSA